MELTKLFIFLGRVGSLTLLLQLCLGIFCRVLLGVQRRAPFATFCSQSCEVGRNEDQKDISNFYLKL